MDIEKGINKLIEYFRDTPVGEGDEFGALAVQIAIRHQAFIISQQSTLIHQLRGALGYPVQGDIIGNPEIVNGIAEALSQQLSEQAETIERLKNELRECCSAIGFNDEQKTNEVDPFGGESPC